MRGVTRPQTPAEIDELLNALEDTIAQACWIENVPGSEAQLDSMALSSYATAMRLLAHYGRIVILHQYGRRVIARWTTDEERGKDAGGV